jgi:hypothetical protein
MLSKLFGEPELKAKLSSFRRLAYSNANFALGLLYYGARQFRESRHYLLPAVLADPRIVIKHQFIATGLKSLLSPGFVNKLKYKRQKTASWSSSHPF